MKWLSRGSVGLGFAKSSKLEKLHGASCDTTLPIEALEAETAMRVARENERCEAGKQVEDRLILTEMAMRLRVSLFAEVSTTTICMLHTCTIFHFQQTKSPSSLAYVRQ